MGWIGVDLDGTLAHFSGWGQGIGAPIPEMMERVVEWINRGQEVRIFTARAAIPSEIPPVEAWLAEQGLPPLEVTNVKDLAMTELWDDRAVRVIHNTGHPCCDGRGNYVL